MDIKRMRRSIRKGYLITLSAFIVFMAVSIFTFFLSIQRNVEVRARELVIDSVARQNDHFQTVMKLQYEYLEAIADFIGQQEELVSEQTFSLIRSIGEKSGLDRVAIFDAQGNGYYDNGMQKQVAGRHYFNVAMAGSRALSDPLESMLDGEMRIILGVPIRRGEETVGVLGGSYNIDALNHMIFQNVYGGEGYSLILTRQGQVVSCEALPDEELYAIGEDFFGRLEGIRFERENTAGRFVENIKAGEAGYARIRFSQEDELCYLAYAPMQMNDWILCYIVPETKVQEMYQFIRKDELILALVLLAGVGVLVLFIWRLNRRYQIDLIDYAQTDALTVVCNKQRTEEEIDAWLKDERCYQMQVFMMLDIDNFKMINDTYGHAVGDDVLRGVSEMLRKEFRSGDIIGRVGGDEFVVMMKNIPTRDVVTRHAASLRSRIGSLPLPDDSVGEVRCSIGIAYAPKDGCTYMELYRRSDEALYCAKNNGRDRFCEYGQEPEVGNEPT